MKYCFFCTWSIISMNVRCIRKDFIFLEYCFTDIFWDNIMQVDLDTNIRKFPPKHWHFLRHTWTRPSNLFDYHKSQLLFLSNAVPCRINANFGPGNHIHISDHYGTLNKKPTCSAGLISLSSALCSCDHIVLCHRVI